MLSTCEESIVLLMTDDDERIARLAALETPGGPSREAPVRNVEPPPPDTTPTEVSVTDISPRRLDPSRTSAALQPHQKHTIAMAMVQGMPQAEIATLVRHTPAYLKRCIETDPEISKLYDHYSTVVMEATVKHRIKLMEMLPQAYDAIEAGLNDGDTRVRMQAADRVFKEVAPQSNQAGPMVDIHIGESGVDAESQKIIGDAVQGIAALLEEIKAGPEIKPMETYIRTDLPGPEDVKGHDTTRGTKGG